MKKIIKKRNSKRAITSRYKFAFIAVAVLYLVCTFILKNHNISLDHELQSIQNENTQLITTNQTLRIKVDELSSFERMSNIAQKSGLENREGAIKNVK